MKKGKIKRKRISGINCQQIGDVFLIDVVCQFVVQVKLENSNQPIFAYTSNIKISVSRRSTCEVRLYKGRV